MCILSSSRALAALLVFVPLFAPAVPPPKPVDNAARFVAVQRQIDAAISARTVPSIAIAAVERGRVIWMHVSGWADVGARRKASPDTAYRIGSVSKSLTASVAAIAKGDGRIDLTQPLSRYLPAFAPATHLGAARLQDLLDMNAGLVQAVHYRGFPGDFADLDPDRFVADYAIAPLASSNRYAYSNIGPELVARAIGAAVGEPFAQFQRKRLFTPLHMSNTQCRTRALAPAVLATGYWPDRTPIMAAYETDPAAGAGCASSLRDLIGYANFHLSTMPPGKGPLGPVALARLHTPREGSDYANGWGRIGSGDLMQLISDGQVNGGEAVILLAPVQRAGIVVLTNAANGIVYALAQAALEVLVPGTSAEFKRGVTQLQTDREGSIARGYPPNGPWHARGNVIVGGVARPFNVDASADAVDVNYGESASQRGKALDRDDGFARWEIPCADFLPACRQGANATARLLLVRDGNGYAGAIAVESRLGLFPYEVHLVPSS